MEGKYVVKSYVKEDVYFLGFSMGESPLVADDPLEISHVRIDGGRPGQSICLLSTSMSPAVATDTPYVASS